MGAYGRRCIVTGAVLAFLSAAQGVAITVSPPEASGIGTNVVTSDSVTVSVEGGTPTDIQWVKLSGGSISATNPTSLTTQFVGAGFIGPELRTAEFACNVTVNGVVYQSPVVPVTLERF